MRRAASSRALKDDAGKEIKMEYLVVFVTMLMIAGYALIIGRCMHNADQH